MLRTCLNIMNVFRGEAEAYDEHLSGLINLLRVEACVCRAWAVTDLVGDSWAVTNLVAAVTNLVTNLVAGDSRGLDVAGSICFDSECSYEDEYIKM